MKIGNFLTIEGGISAERMMSMAPLNNSRSAKLKDLSFGLILHLLWGESLPFIRFPVPKIIDTKMNCANEEKIDIFCGSIRKQQKWRIYSWKIRSFDLMTDQKKIWGTLQMTFSCLSLTFHFVFLCWINFGSCDYEGHFVDWIFCILQNERICDPCMKNEKFYK